MILKEIKNKVHILLLYINGFEFKDFKEGNYYVIQNEIETKIINILCKNKIFKNLQLTETNVEKHIYDFDTVNTYTLETHFEYKFIIDTLEIYIQDKYLYYGKKMFRFEKIKFIDFLLEIYNNNLEELNSNLEKCLFLVL